MTLDDLIGALGLPEGTLVNQRVPKKLLAEQEVATSSDRRQIQEGVDEVCWLAALKPHLIGVPAYEDAHRQYLELAVLSLSLKPGTKPGRLLELLHRAVPYPVVLLTSSDAGINLSLAHLRRSQNEADKTVLDGELMTVALPSEPAPGTAVACICSAFCDAFSLARQPQGDLHALYQGWMDTVAALDIARETGRFQTSTTREQAAERHLALQKCRQLKTRLTELRGRAQRERQVARQIDLNLEIKQLLASIDALQATLNPGSLR